MARRRADVDLRPESLLGAYASGAFPMADPESGRVHYYACDPRCLIPLDDRFHISKSLARIVRSGRFTIRYDTMFAQVIRACAGDRDEENRNWISDAMIAAYEELHTLGFAHSVEAWRDDSLVAGLYGVTLGAAFFGESMFSRPEAGGRDASKVCLVHLVHTLRERSFQLLDSQYANDHIMRFGAFEILAAEYEVMLEAAVSAGRKW
ncbi:MAG: leucyl/phenylalanyl-tRNA--protein transferase [Phycisphaerae bacterium]|nr:leucyl/phenylalanyl-tRNA--protein transferase [Phycisphaerae bacterium]